VIRHFSEFSRNIFRKKRIDQGLGAEIGSYLESMAAEKVRCGITPEEACREALRVWEAWNKLKRASAM
jgi:hypothetical protein